MPGPVVILEIEFLELYVMISEQNLELCIYISRRTITDLFVKDHKM